MFDILKNLDLLKSRLHRKNQLFGGTVLFKTTLYNNICIVVRVGGSLKSNNRLFENCFDISKSEDFFHTNTKFITFYKFLQTDNSLEEFKLRLEEELLINV